MASKIQAISAYRPRLKLDRTTDMEDLVEYIARSTGLNESGVRQVLLELRDAVISFNRQGRAVKIEGLGIYAPTIDLKGKIKIGHRPDTALTKALNKSGFRGNIENRENIGKSSDDLVAMWNAEHPDNPVA